MAEAQPTLDINLVRSANVQYDVPTQLPPAGSDTRGMMSIAGTQAGAFAAARQAMQAAPTLPTTAGGAMATITAWQSGKKVNALWTINEDRNSWFGAEGIGWRHLANVDETSVTALTMLAAHARFSGSPINYREENDGLVHEIYVW